MQSKNPNMPEVKKGKTKGIFDVRQDTSIQQMLFKSNDKEINKLLEIQKTAAAEKKQKMSTFAEPEEKKMTLDEANVQIQNSETIET